jgi:hypothetical protein
VLTASGRKRDDDTTQALFRSCLSIEPGGTMTETASNDKYYKGQRVFAKDDSSGILYEAVIRRTMVSRFSEFESVVGIGTFVFSRTESSHLVSNTFSPRSQHGIARQPRQKIAHEDSDDEEEEEKPEWHCFVHFLGWNVKWDRWVSEDRLYEVNDKTKLLAQKLQEAVREVKKKYGKGPQVMIELQQRMKRLEQEQRLEERREELAKQGIAVEESDQKLTKAHLKKELSRREQGLEARRKQVHAEKLAMTSSNMLVEEWEVITQCNMVPTIPAKVTVQQALDAYLASKIGAPPTDSAGTDVDQASGGASETVRESENSKGTDDDERETPAERQVQDLKQANVKVKTDKDEAAPPQVIKNDDERETPTEGQVQELKQGDAQVETNKDEAAPPEVITSDGKQQESSKQDASNDKKQKQEWKDMVDGIALLFDQAIDTRLLYRQELPQHEWIQQQQELANLRYCQIYGCEHLLRLFLRLPGLIEDDAESRPIFSKLNDLVRYLQKHQSTIFLQSYHTPSRKREAANTTARRAKKRKRKPIDSPSPQVADAAEESLSVEATSSI